LRNYTNSTLHPHCILIGAPLACAHCGKWWDDSVSAVQLGSITWNTVGELGKESGADDQDVLEMHDLSSVAYLNDYLSFFVVKIL
jgi:hypothetical protein